jgi:hypothetical protein
LQRCTHDGVKEERKKDRDEGWERAAHLSGYEKMETMSPWLLMMMMKDLR